MKWHVTSIYVSLALVGSVACRAANDSADGGVRDIDFSDAPYDAGVTDVGIRDVAPDIGRPDVYIWDVSTPDAGPNPDGGYAQEPYYVPESGLRPDFPAGWSEIRSHDGVCHYYAPTELAVMPTGAVWRTCSYEWAPSGSLCIRSENWMNPTNLWGLSFMQGENGGPPILSYIQSAPWGQVWVAQRLDGEVVSAIVGSSSVDCRMMYSSLADGNFAVSAGDKKSGMVTAKRGVLHSSMGDIHPDQAWWAYNEAIGDGVAGLYYASKEWLVSWYLGSIFVRPWSGGSFFGIASGAGDPNGLSADPGETLIIGDAVIMTVSSVDETAIMVWDMQRGLRPLIRGDLAIEGSGNMGYDGANLVWSYGVGRNTPNDYNHSEYYLRMAPFSTDAETLAANIRTVVREVGGLLGIGHNYQAACGLAARINVFNEIQIVRLQDGAIWLIPALETPFNQKGWGMVIGITCDEIFVIVQPKLLVDDLVRIPLASLGPPTIPPP